MSGKVSDAVWGLVLSRAQREVLIAMAGHASDNGTGCYPSVRLLAWKTDLSERQVQRVLRDLEAQGLIMAVGNAKGGRGLTTEYHIRLENGIPKPPLKGDVIVSPLEPEKGDILDQNGDIIVSPIPSEKGDISGQKGDIQMSPEPIEPLREVKEVVVAEKKSKRKKPEGFPIPDGFEPTPEMYARAEKKYPLLDVYEATDQWITSMQARQDKYLYTNWNAAWWNGMRYADERRAKNGGQDSETTKLGRAIMAGGREIAQLRMDPLLRERTSGKVDDNQGTNILRLPRPPESARDRRGG